MKIDPSSTTTALDYGENPDKTSAEQDKGTGSGPSTNDEGYQPIVPPSNGVREVDRSLKERKARKKKKQRRKRKLTERKARQDKDQDS